ncbi:aromatic ring-hydroxylating oxygenase subunit alpha [Hydrogenophilus thermoluteolus]|uniref:Rieske (2Fe-2S) domain-containing protein n=1 Tax=Hydrogenophilus thermoluteolus TaxID=297 RepID=A0A2Z6DVL0_HYDTE|nr:aromatic ring-hydroxylating dioxygenase subunit alpha [Hydrogenophilus thermoluteolus]BBD76476.1 Rieske (2Fe-2S) domain-containing protein [Hydrogenophilus thermoluteolus]HCO77713.1 Rieske (2Fe-2S) protein [Rhodocyclaceae bacterium]HNQ48902.1 aromatic ring-hydroxylating dioxygenase subunit alpha [Hydrogenophilus thermoluteolus]
MGQLQFPVSWYFDEALYQKELEVLFKNGPGYLGHELMVPEVGCYRALEQFDEGMALVRDRDGVHLLSNICRHRQAIMLRGSGKTEQIVCPLHRWSYALDGKLIGAPHFPENPCLNLTREAVQNWHGLLFRGPRDVRADLADMKPQFADRFDFSGYKLDRVVAHECHYNWKTFVEVYLEDYHVVPFHPGLGNFVDCDQLEWQFGKWYSVQRVGITSLARAGSPTYEKWHQAVLAHYNGQLPKDGAIWLMYYPNVMVEWYPHSLVVSTLWPQGVDKTLNLVEFYYPEAIVEFEREFVEAEQAAYMETAVEDDEIAERMDRGRKVLWQEGRNEVGPYQSPYEDGMPHFHAFYRRVMAEHLKE